MIASFLVATVSLISPACWFRFVCRLILTAEPVSARIADVAAAHQLMFLEVQRSLNDAVERVHFDALMRRLARDYRRVRNLIRTGSRPEHHLLHLNFQLLKLYYVVVRTARLSNGRAALEEMAQVVGYFTNQLAVTISS